MNYRGIENIYGNVWKHVDGLNLDGSYNVWVADHGFADATFTSPYVNTSLVALNNAASDAADITTSSTYDYGFITLTGGATASTGLCTLYGGQATYPFAMGGGYNTGAGTDINAFTLFSALEVAADFPTGYGMRLMYVG